MSTVVSIDGSILPPEKAMVNVFDHGFLFGDSVYEVVRTRRGIPVTMDEHLARLEGSADRIYMKMPWSRADIAARLAGALRAAGNPESYVRIIATRGVGEISLLPDSCKSPSLILIVKPLPVPPPTVAKDGLKVTVPARPRNDRRALDPSAKTGNYLNNLLALVEAHRGGNDDAVLLNPAGMLAEATTSNLFLVKGGVVRTPSLSCGILAGITRDLLVREMARSGIPVEEGEYPAAALFEADEAFLTSTIRGVAPVTRVNGEPVGGGRPGPVAAKVAALYDAALDRLAATAPPAGGPAA